MTDRQATRTLLSAFLLAGLLLFTPWTSQGHDENSYYRWLSSMVFDGDLDLANDFMASGEDPLWLVRDIRNITVTGRGPNFHSVGPALMWGTVLTPVVLAERLVHDSATWKEDHRYAWRYRILISLVTFAAVCHATLLLFHCLRRFYPPGVSLAAAALATLGSPLLAYATHDNAMSHGAAFWATTVVWWLSLSLWENPPGRAGLRDWAIGLAVGYAALSRWSLVVWALLPAAVYIRNMCDPQRRTASLLGAVIATLASLTLFSLQMIAWKTLYGEWIHIPQGSAFLTGEIDGDLRPPALVGVLFSPWNGLFSSHPWLLIALVGIALWARRAPALALGGALALIATWFINARVLDWWSGSSFGNRRFCNALPIFAFGFAAALNLLPAGTPRRWIGGGFTVLVLIANAAFTVLWARAIFPFAWWNRFPLWGDVFRAALANPFAWLDGIIWQMNVNTAKGLMIAVTLTLLITLVVGLVWLASRGDRPPWPRGRAATAATALVTGYVTAILAATLAAMPRSPHLKSHLALREALRVGIDSPLPLNIVEDRQWDAIRAPDFHLDLSCPLHLAAGAHLAATHGAQFQATEWLRLLESDFPRLAGLITLLEIDDVQEKRRTLRLLIDERRLGDSMLEGVMVDHAVKLHDPALLAEVLAFPSVAQVRRLEAELLSALVNNQVAERETFLRRRLRIAPMDLDAASELGVIADAQGRDAIAALERARVRRWSGAALAIWERIARHHPREVAIWGNGDIHYQGASRLNLFDPHIRPAPDQEEAEVLYVRLETLMQGLGTWEHIARLRVDQLTELARMEDDPSAREPWLARAELIAANSLFEPQRVAARATIASRRGQWHEALALLRHGAEQFPMEVDWIAAAERAAPLPDDPSEAHQVLETTESDARGLVAVALARGAAVASDYPSSLRWIMEAVQSSLPHDRTQAIAGQILSEATAYSEDTGNFLESRTICGVADPLIQILPRSPGVQILLSRMRAAARLWPSSLRAIEEGERLFPDEADWLTLSIFATRGFGPGEIKEDLLDPLITEELGLASVALALRCSELEEHRQALQWMRRAQIEGRSPEENWAQEIWPMANHVFTQAATFARSSDLETRAALLPLLEQHASDYPDDRAAQHTVAEIRRLTASP